MLVSVLNHVIVNWNKFILVYFAVPLAKLKKFFLNEIFSLNQSSQTAYFFLIYLAALFVLFCFVFFTLSLSVHFRFVGNVLPGYDLKWAVVLLPWCAPCGWEACCSLSFSVASFTAPTLQCHQQSVSRLLISWDLSIQTR